jgi:hypothetical protein
MYAPEASPQPIDPQRHLVDLQYEEVSKTRMSVLNRESVRMQNEGWTVQLAEDHLVCTRREEGRSQMERVLIGIGGFLALAYAATIFLADTVASLPIPKAVFLVGAAALGAAVAFFTSNEAARDRRATVGVDGHGRAFMTEQGRDF